MNEQAVRAIFDGQRLQSLDKLRDLVKSNGPAIAQAIFTDFEVGFVDVFERLGPPWGRLASFVTQVFTKR